VRDRIRVYWSHCATWRINPPTLYKPAITSLDGVKAIGAEVRDKGFSALKTNIFIYDGGALRGWRPGFGVSFAPELNVDKQVLRNLRAHLEAMRDGAGPNVDLLLDLNFNAKTEGYPKILRAIADLLGLREFLRYFREQAMDVAIVGGIAVDEHRGRSRGSCSQHRAT
jgi:galactonate dehydratase